MLDDLSKRPNGGDSHRDRAPRTPQPAGPLADREVPLASARPLEAMHRWLDGEGSEADALRGESARYVELWRRIEAETERRRHLATPAHLQDRIMLAIPHDLPQPAAETALWRRKSVEVTPLTAAAAAAGLLALGVVLVALLR